jgi:hypothetical protein
MHAEDQNKTGGFQYDPGIYGIGRRYSNDGKRGIWGLRGFWDTSSYRRFFSSYWGADHQVYVSEGVRDKWVHIAHIYTGEFVQVYVNGFQCLNAQQDGIETQNFFPLQFGRWTDETTGWVIDNNMHRRSFKGWLDDFRVYDEALHENEVQAIYGEGAGDFQVHASFEIPSVVDGDPTEILI